MANLPPLPPALLQTLLSWTETAARTEEVGDFLDRALDDWLALTEASYVAWLRPGRGRWTTVADCGKQRSLPYDDLGEALDRGNVVSNGGWMLFPVRAKSSANANESPVDGFLAMHNEATCQIATDDLTRWSKQLGSLLDAVSRHERRRTRVQRLETLLDIAAQWNQTHEMEPLLERMAEASTRLLQSERASIFLWDRSNRVLVGRPALGVEGGALEIPEDVGVVGHVVQTGEISRVDEGSQRQAEEIHRDVDQQLKFHTRNLLCVPLRAADGEIFGAFEVLNKTVGDYNDEDEEALVELAAHASVALENTQQLEELLQSRQQIVEEAASGVEWVGECAAVTALRKTIERVAPTELSILVLGENGTGKDVVARMTHYLSERRDQPFVAVNCAAISETLLESELFGHEKGAFTGAHEERAGKFETASGGTLFLDEIGDMSLDGQASLLRVLEDKTVVRVGGSRPIATDTRVFAATNQNLVELVQKKKFREDLYYRLNVVTLELPPLRERGDDIVLLAEHFLKTYAERARRKTPKFTAAAKRRLAEHDWPGNVRELRNLMERLAYLSDDERIDAPDLSFILSPGSRGDGAVNLNATLADATRDFQVEFIQKQIDAARGRMTDAAKRLGLHRSNLYRKMKQLGMAVDDSE